MSTKFFPIFFPFVPDFYLLLIQILHFLKHIQVSLMSKRSNNNSDVSDVSSSSSSTVPSKKSKTSKVTRTSKAKTTNATKAKEVHEVEVEPKKVHEVEVKEVHEAKATKEVSKNPTSSKAKAKKEAKEPLDPLSSLLASNSILPLPFDATNPKDRDELASRVDLLLPILVPSPNAPPDFDLPAQLSLIKDLFNSLPLDRFNTFPNLLTSFNLALPSPPRPAPLSRKLQMEHSKDTKDFLLKHWHDGLRILDADQQLSLPRRYLKIRQLASDKNSLISAADDLRRQIDSLRKQHKALIEESDILQQQCMEQCELLAKDKQLLSALSPHLSLDHSSLPLLACTKDPLSSAQKVIDAFDIALGSKAIDDLPSHLANISHKAQKQHPEIDHLDQPDDMDVDVFDNN